VDDSTSVEDASPVSVSATVSAAGSLSSPGSWMPSDIMLRRTVWDVTSTPSASVISSKVS
jgi:hypothetical protein